jgi:FKBP-type peptidyl-prolyl cis-trans isomerase
MAGNFLRLREENSLVGSTKGQLKQQHQQQHDQFSRLPAGAGAGVGENIAATSCSGAGGGCRPLEFEIGKGDVIRGLEVAVQRMVPGQVVEVVCPHMFAYGDRGHPPEIPPRATLCLVVELLEVLYNNNRNQQRRRRRNNNHNNETSRWGWG